MSRTKPTTRFDELEARMMLELDKNQFAEMLGISRDMVNKVEGGRAQLGAAARRLLQAYLDGYRPKDWPV